jgi:hypothetical protein
VSRIGAIGICVIAACLIAGLVIGQVTPNEVGFYLASPVVKVEGPAETILDLNVTKTVDLTLKKTSGETAMVDTINWVLYDADGNFLTAGSKDFMPPEEITGKESLSIDVKYAGAYTGDGTLKFTASGRDTKYGQPINSIPGYTSVEIKA